MKTKVTISRKEAIKELSLCYKLYMANKKNIDYMVDYCWEYSLEFLEEAKFLAMIACDDDDIDISNKKLSRTVGYMESLISTLLDSLYHYTVVS